MLRGGGSEGDQTSFETPAPTFFALQNDKSVRDVKYFHEGGVRARAPGSAPGGATRERSLSVSTAAVVRIWSVGNVGLCN